MKYIPIVMLSLTTFNARAATDCAKPAWFQESVQDSGTYLVSFAQSSLLTEAIGTAEDKLWTRIYAPSEDAKFLAADFYSKSSPAFSQTQVDRAVRSIFQWTLNGRKKERRYVQICNTYYVEIKIAKKAIDAALQDRTILQQYVYFILNGKGRAIKAEVYWHEFWRKSGFVVEDKSKEIEKAEALSEALKKQTTESSKTLAELVTRYAKNLDDLYIKLYMIRGEEPFLKARHELVPKVIQFDHIYQAALAASDNKFTDAYRHAKALAQLGIAEGYYLAGLMSMELNKEGKEDAYAETFQLMSHASHAGIKDANKYVADAYLTGKGTAKSLRKALDFLEGNLGKDNYQDYIKAAEILIKGGPNLPKNPDQGTKYLKKAGNMVDPNAALAVGKFYLSGHIPKDSSKAAFWLEEAKKKGSKEAAALLGSASKTDKTAPKPTSQPKAGTPSTPSSAPKAINANAKSEKK